MIGTSELAVSPAVQRRLRSLLSGWPIYPALIFLVIMFLFPVAWILSLSVVNDNGTLSGEQFVRLFATPLYVRVLLVTFEISALSTLLCVLAGYPVASLLSMLGGRWGNRLTLCVLLPFWTSFLVRTFAWIILLGNRGPVNELLQALGITQAPLPLSYNLTGVLIGMLHALMPTTILIMVSVMRNIDMNLLYAASTLGARGGQAFLRIYLPLSMPGVAAAGLLTFISALGFFITPALLGAPAQTMIAQFIIQLVQELLDWRFASALSLLLLAVTILFFFLYNRIFGLSTLPGGVSGRARGLSGRSKRIARVASSAGNRAVNGLGWVCDWAAHLLDRLHPTGSTRPQRWQTSAIVLWAYAGLVVAFLLLPTLFVVPVSFGGGEFIRWPPTGLTLRWYVSYFASEQWRTATLRSLGVAITTGILAIAFGTPAAFVLTRRRMLWKQAILAFTLSPLVVPRIVYAVALFYLYSQLKLVGTSVGLILGYTVVAIPYVVITVMAVLRTYDEHLDQAASSLGANTLQTLYHITFPLIRLGLIAAFVFAFVTAFDELTIALFVCPGLTATLPRLLWSAVQHVVSPLIMAVSSVLVVFISAVLLFAESLRRRTETGRIGL